MDPQKIQIDEGLISAGPLDYEGYAAYVGVEGDRTPAARGCLTAEQAIEVGEHLALIGRAALARRAEHAAEQRAGHHVHEPVPDQNPGGGAITLASGVATRRSS